MEQGLSEVGLAISGGKKTCGRLRKLQAVCSGWLAHRSDSKNGGFWVSEQEINCISRIYVYEYMCIYVCMYAHLYVCVYE